MNTPNFRTPAIIGWLILLPPLSQASPDPAPHRQELAAVVRDYEVVSAEADPVAAGQRGDAGAARRWPDNSSAARAGRAARLRDIETRLRGIPAQGLSGEDILNQTLLEWRIGMDLKGEAFDEARIPFTSDEGFYRLPDFVAAASVLRTVAEAHAWLDRLAALPAYYEIETANMRRGLRTAFTQSRVTALAALQATDTEAAVPAGQDPLLAPINALPATVPAADRAALHRQALDIIDRRIKPAERQLAVFFRDTYVPQARDTIGASALPNGRAYYTYLVQRETTTDMSPDAVFALGEAEIARLQSAMQAQLKAAGFTGGFAAFQAMLRTDKRFVALSPQALLEHASWLAKRVDDQLPRLFGRLPRLSYGVRPVPHDIEEGYTTARYFPGSPEQGVAGGLMVNTSHLDQRPLYELPALVAHEGAPGHHIQIALAQEMTGLPPFRRDMQITAFVEGWALYAEQLGTELGLYATPYEKFGLLSMEMWRACRLVMDVGIHWRGWTRDQALGCLRDHTALAEHNMQSEVDRYISWPGQALGYKVGELRIVALRHRAETALGPRFDERAFHDLVLDEGAMPLWLLEARVNAWLKPR